MRIYEKLIDRGEKDSKLLGVLLQEILDDLIEARKYPVIIAGLSDPLAMVEREIESYRSIKEYEKSNRREGMPSAAGHFKKAVLDKGGKIFEALVGVKDSTRAHQVAKRLIKFNGNAATYESLIDHAATAGGTDEAEWLLQQARKKLKKDDLDELEKRARKTKAK